MYRISFVIHSFFFQHLNRKYKANVPLVLMNSFNTSEDTAKIIQRYEGLQLEIYTFSQSAYPRIYKDTLLPVPKNCVVDKDSQGYVFKLHFIN